MEFTACKRRYPVWGRFPVHLGDDGAGGGGGPRPDTQSAVPDLHGQNAQREMDHGCYLGHLEPGDVRALAAVGSGRMAIVRAPPRGLPSCSMEDRIAAVSSRASSGRVAGRVGNPTSQRLEMA